MHAFAGPDRLSRCGLMAISVSETLNTARSMRSRPWLVSARQELSNRVCFAEAPGGLKATQIRARAMLQLAPRPKLAQARLASRYTDRGCLAGGPGPPVRGRSCEASWPPGGSKSDVMGQSGMRAWFIRRCSVVRPFIHRLVLVSGRVAAGGRDGAWVPAGRTLAAGRVPVAGV